MTDVAELTKKLISIPSVNPMGRSLDPAITEEIRLTDFLESFFSGLGIPYRRQMVSERRENIVANVEFPGAKDTILFEVHQDTVPVDNMTVSPFAGEVRDGRVWGRGACDVKGGMAAMLCALERLVREKPENAASVIMACTVDEEHTFTGIKRFLKEGCTATMAVVSEPTQLKIITAHKGLVRWKIQTNGRSCHSANPEQGKNAVYAMAPVLQALSKYAQSLQAGDLHPLVGSPTLSVGVVRGGTSVNTVPDFCEIEIDRRLIPGEDAGAAYRNARDAVLSSCEEQSAIVFHEPWLTDPALDTPSTERVVHIASEAARSVLGVSSIEGVPYGTDASKIAQTGIPSVVLGPGDISQAHTVNEWIDIDQLKKAVDIYYRILVASE